MNCIVAAFYRFVPLPDYRELQPILLAFCREHKIKGSILLAPEGINGTIAGERTAIDAVFGHLHTDPRFADLTWKESQHETPPFARMKVRLKREIVGLGVPGIDPNKTVGTYVPAEQWNAVISDPDVLVIDTRNDYEVSVGTFPGAVNPGTESFRQFPEFVRTHLDPAKHAKVAMFCTGGIRCEKASSFLLAQGFPEVLHLEGGILKYLETVPADQSLWQGECFVFDERVAVDHDLQAGSAVLCPGCGDPIVQGRESPCPKCRA